VIALIEKNEIRAKPIAEEPVRGQINHGKPIAENQPRKAHHGKQIAEKLITEN
jgi:hypothetical protein